MEQSHFSLEANICIGSTEIYCLLWNMQVHYHVHKSPSVIQILSHVYPDHTCPII
jgi:hypothetical protein